MKLRFNLYHLLFILLLLMLMFKNWLFADFISAGDFSLGNVSLKDISLYPYIWYLTGLGYNGSFLLFSYPLTFPLFLLGKIFGISIASKIIYFYSFLIYSSMSSVCLFKKIIGKSEFWIFSILLFLFNTYILMVVDGGQMGIALAYSLTPIVIYLYLNLFEKIEENLVFKKLNYSLVAGLILSLQTIFDLRIAYITLIAIFLLWLLKNIEKKNLRYFINSLVFCFVIPGIISFLLNAFWLLPTILNRKNPIEELGVAYSSLEAVKFFSFAKLEDTISLLHPNWPENIFGKTGFLKPEFLILPTIAFSSLLFVKSVTKDKRFFILFFALLGLLGIFLAKGANDPFGGIYLWLFDNLPGFIMFRDPTKWYTLIALSYSMLIPFTIWKIYEFLSTKYKKIKYSPQVFLILVIAFLLFLIRPALLGQLSGTFKTTQIPQDYIKLEKFLASQNNFSRTLWVPTIQRFGYYSNSHPAIPAQILFKTVENTEILKKMNTKETEVLLQEASVKYIVIPYDSQGEIFLKDRKYNEKMYLQVANGINSIEWFKKTGEFGKIKVFEVSNPKDHFWTNTSNINLKYQYISPVEYKLEVKNAKIGDKIIFSENYDASWIARDSQTKFYDWPNLISSNPYSRIFNSFSLRKAGNYSLTVYYYPQTAVNLGVIISLSSFILVLAFIIFGSKLKKW